MLFLRAKDVVYGLAIILIGIICFSCTKINDNIVLDNSNTLSLQTSKSKPNIIVILIDDIGYEVPQSTGGESYSTPIMNSLTKYGMQFTHCYASAACSPSRITLLTGKYGFRNYHEWGILDTTQKTIANILQDRGYETCVSGKWQLDGGNTSIHTFGFNSYSVLDPFTEADSSIEDENATRYKNPVIYQNSSYLPDAQTQGKYSDDLFADYATNFIIQNKTKPFFLYFSFSECHKPFSPPPNNPDFIAWNPLTDDPKPKYFPDMVSYMDSKIYDILSTVSKQGLRENTYIFVFADNGTPREIVSQFRGRSIRGGKFTTNEFGNHVPLIVIGPTVKPNSVCRDIIDFTDFMPTVATLAKIPKQALARYGIMDGQSFANQLNGATATPRTSSYDYYFPYSNAPLDKRVYVQDTTYKLYDITYNNSFYNMQTDSLEQFPIPDNQLTPNEKNIKKNFQSVLASMHS